MEFYKTMSPLQAELIQATLRRMSAHQDSISQLVVQFVGQLEAHITASLQARIVGILGGLKGPARRGRPPGSTNKVAAVAKVRKPASPAVRKRRQLQGKYLGTLRGLNASDRARVKAVAQKDGVAAALKAASKLS